MFKIQNDQLAVSWFMLWYYDFQNFMLELKTRQKDKGWIWILVSYFVRQPSTCWEKVRWIVDANFRAYNRHQMKTLFDTLLPIFGSIFVVLSSFIFISNWSILVFQYYSSNLIAVLLLCLLKQTLQPPTWKQLSICYAIYYLTCDLFVFCW